MSVIFFIQTFSHIFFLKNTKGVFINHVDTCAKLFHCPNAFYRIEVELINKIAHSVLQMKLKNSNLLSVMFIKLFSIHLLKLRKSTHSKKVTKYYYKLS